MENTEIKSFYFRGVKIDNVGLENICEVIYKNKHRKGYLCLNDVRNIMTATKDSELRDAINESLLSIADGTPLSWYGKLLGYKNVQRVAGFELLSYMLEDQNGYKHYLLGDTEETISRVIAKAKMKNSQLQIAGYSPPFREHFSEKDAEIMFNNINKEDPDIIWVCFGGGKQEKWMHQNISKLNRGIMAGVGAAFRFYIGDIYIPPIYVQKIGMQWLFRMIGSSKAFHIMIHTHPKFFFYFPFEVIKGKKMYRAERK